MQGGEQVVRQPCRYSGKVLRCREEEREDGAMVDGVLAAAEADAAVVAAMMPAEIQRPRPVPLRSLVV